MEQLVIAGRFNGPAESGNGGYTCGLVAGRLPRAAQPAGGGRTAQVTLRVPPPLDTPLRVGPAGDGGEGIEVYAGDQLVAEAAPVALPDDPPVAPITYPDAVAASVAYPGFVDHPFPTCYVCGPRRTPGNEGGLRIFPGPVPDGRTAAPWLVPDGCTEVTVWAALDCPGGWAILAPGRPYVLGRMAARVEQVPPAGAACVVLGEVVATEGRKAQVRSALYRGDPATGRPHLLASARSTWIAV